MMRFVIYEALNRGVRPEHLSVDRTRHEIVPSGFADTASSVQLLSAKTGLSSGMTCWNRFCPSRTFDDGSHSAGGFQVCLVRRVQLSLLDAEDELLQIAKRIDIAYFLEARTRASKGPTTLAWLKVRSPRPTTSTAFARIRRQCRFLVTIGTARPPAEFRPCATGPMLMNSSPGLCDTRLYSNAEDQHAHFRPRQ